MPYELIQRVVEELREALSRYFGKVYQLSIRSHSPSISDCAVSSCL